MEAVKAIIPSFIVSPDDGRVIKTGELKAECPVNCVFIEARAAGRYKCALADSLKFAVDAVIANPGFMMQPDRWPGPTGVDCPANVGFDGENLYLKPTEDL